MEVIRGLILNACHDAQIDCEDGPKIAKTSNFIELPMVPELPVAAAQSEAKQGAGLDCRSQFVQQVLEVRAIIKNNQLEAQRQRLLEKAAYEGNSWAAELLERIDLFLHPASDCHS